MTSSTASLSTINAKPMVDSSSIPSVGKKGMTAGALFYTEVVWQTREQSDWVWKY